MTVAELGRRMSGQEFLEWNLLDRIEAAEVEAARAQAAAQANRG